MHLAIIMDGNGRWAQDRDEPRSYGHIIGSKNTLPIIKYLTKIERVKTLTLYAFSSENVKRPNEEKNIIMELLKEHVLEQKDVFIKNGIEFKLIGNKKILTKELSNIIKTCEKCTFGGSNLRLNIAFNYGAKDEMLRAINSIDGIVTEANLQKSLDVVDEVDILIRTGGYQRLSNFLLWQISYAELFFTDTYWPDFKTQELENIINEFDNIKRNFGDI